ncbi:MAG: hypothetical protein IJ323_05615 [Clostridia bacterium]|nr:hypothetical protein [Clostridia bacterium]
MKKKDEITDNPMFRPDGHVDLPTIHAEAYDVNLPYSGTLRHMRDVKKAMKKKDEKPEVKM